MFNSKNRDARNMINLLDSIYREMKAYRHERWAQSNCIGKLPEEQVVIMEDAIQDVKAWLREGGIK